MADRAGKPLMYSGIIEHIGQVLENEVSKDGARLLIKLPAALSETASIGDSIAVNGCCLTLAGLPGDGHALFHMGQTTLAHTAPLEAGDKVHLEASLRLGDQVGGHFVTGHVDGCTEALAWNEAGKGALATFAMPPKLDARLIAPQGSVAIAGVSLSVASVCDASFCVQLVPHTMEVTLLNRAEALRDGAKCNLEVDCFARYTLRCVAPMLESAGSESHKRSD